MKQMQSLGASAALVCCMTLSAQAQEFSGGLGVSISTSPYVGEDSEVQPLPLFRYQGDGFSVGADGVSVDVLENGLQRAAVVIRPRFTALDDPDAVELAGIDRDITLDLGVEYDTRLGNGLFLSAAVLAEITGEHDGFEAKVAAENRLSLGQLPVSLSGGLSWKNDDLSNYIYGVTAAEALVGRPAYDTGATLTPFVSVDSGFALGERAQGFAGLGVEFLGSSISDSPIVDEDVIFTLRAGVRFEF